MPKPYSKIRDLNDEELDKVISIQTFVYVVIAWCGFWYVA